MRRISSKVTNKPRQFLTVWTFRSSPGFALLITVILLAFVVLLLVALTSLTRVETQVAVNQQALSEARQNALFALNIAVGQLQKHAGPDARITARAEVMGDGSGSNPYFTGVWDASTSGPDAAIWLVSGSEASGTPAPGLLSEALDPSEDAVADGDVFLVGNRSVATDLSAPTAVEKARRIKLRKQDLLAPAGAIPGMAGEETPRIGRYAWWAGDQGVKASLALPDRSAEVAYAPWHSDDPLTGYDQRFRILQQIGSSPNYFRASTAVTPSALGGFDPLGVAKLGDVMAGAQVGLLDNAGAHPPYWRKHYHDFTTVAHSVLANTLAPMHANAGLMRDLSLKPDELGDAFAAYADYATYMEIPGRTAEGDSVALPEITGEDSPRRRYKISVPVESVSSDPIPGLAFGVAPVITELLLQFSVESGNGCKVGLRAYVGMWNPYTSALVPPKDLYLTLSGLPKITAHSSTSTVTVDLQADLPVELKDESSSALLLKLPFTESGTQADRRSWLPGRVYGWRKNGTDNQLMFYDKNITTAGRWFYSSKALPGASISMSVTVPPVPAGLTVELRNSSGLLATYTTPAYVGCEIPSSGSTKWFGYGFRLKQPSAADKDRSWLLTFDPHTRIFPAICFEGFDPVGEADPAALNPAVYNTHDQNTVQPGFLLYRIQGTGHAANLSSYNDAPLFELPRLPLLSMGQLQHLAITGKRPYSIGNSWGGEANHVFDRFFFSGLSAMSGAPDLGAWQPLPNWNLRVLNGGSLPAIQASGVLSGKHLLQSGGFNINSTSIAAWRAILSGARFKAGSEFQSADLDNTTKLSSAGTQKSSASLVKERFDNDSSLGGDVPAPTFFRFPQSAQETYFWQQPPPPPGDARLFDTYGFRLGVRGNNLSTASVAAAVTAQRLTTDQIELLAAEIVAQIQQRAKTKGPFRRLQEFLNPLSGDDDGTPSLLETAIANSGLNPPSVQPINPVGSLSDFGLCSLTLTQADIVSALAPFLRVRSDTFLVRSYGEAINPITAVVTAKAWLEAMVQRFPEGLDEDDDMEKPAGLFGRRFKIISFRWLSSLDI